MWVQYFSLDPVSVNMFGFYNRPCFLKKPSDSFYLENMIHAKCHYRKIMRWCLGIVLTNKVIYVEFLNYTVSAVF